jgi:RNA polymerase sigma factor (sigma-70 family)
MPLKPVPVGDERELFLRHHQRLLRVIAARVSAPLATVEDACAFAWLQLVRHQPERGERLFGWLATVAYHEALRLIRVERAAEPVDDADLFERPATDRLHAEALEALDCLAALPERQRDLLAGLVAGNSYRELARREGSSYTAINRHLTRARARVREERRRRTAE